MDYMLNRVINEFSQGFQFNFINVCRVTSPIFDEFGGRFCCHCLCILVWVVCMFFQQFSNEEDLPWSKTEFTLSFGAIVVGCLSFVAVVLGALRIVTIVVVVEALPTMVGFVLVGHLIDFH